MGSDGAITMANERLSAAHFKAAMRDGAKPKYHADGRGLYLRVGSGMQRSWCYRFMLRSRAHEMGLGSAHDISLAEAREKVATLRKLKANGIDPLTSKRASAATARASAMTFAECSEAYVKAHSAGWRSAKHTEQWMSSVKAYALPMIGNLPVDAVDTAAVLRCIEPQWTTKTVTMGRVRGRIESVLNWAMAKGYRTGTNPAQWRGHLENLLAGSDDVTASRKKHHAALPYADLPGLFASLGGDVVDRALGFIILTAARTTEVLGADWREIGGDVWTIPGTRMKNGSEHRVPLVPVAIALLGKSQRNGRIFDVSHHDTLRRRLITLVPGATVHGFRATFRVWAAEQTNAPHAVIERCLAHVVENKTARAYQRSDLLA